MRRDIGDNNIELSVGIFAHGGGREGRESTGNGERPTVMSRTIAARHYLEAPKTV